MAEIRFKHLKIKELHPTFAAEITEFDFSKLISPDVFRERNGSGQDRDILQ
jgi:hypothetical protein